MSSLLFGFKPQAGLFVLGKVAFHKLPVPGRVVRNQQVAELVDDDIV